MKNKKQIITLVIFLLGIFLGAIDSGIVSPARVVIQNGFDVSSNIGVWMITIYTLSYAVSMPIVSKLSDTFGRKKVYIISIAIFGIGSALCGLTNFYGSFPLFLAARVIQAIGGGGITPIATAYIGNSFPAEKRGTALGLVGSIYGIATILGPTLGSSILGFAGNNHWGWLFFINVPISIIIIIISFTINEKQEKARAGMDLKGATVVAVTILSLMYALTNLNFFQFTQSITSLKVWPYLLVFIFSLPLLIYIEGKAKDPILNLKYFTDKQIALTLMISFIVGCGLMGVVFVPQFAENVLKIKTGSGGYLVTFMAVFSGFAAPLGGKFVDKYSAKLVLGMGFSCTILGSLVFALFASVANAGPIPIFIGLSLVGFGMGFTMGTPLNYLMLAYVSKDESAAALSTLSLIRSIGVAISPNIMVNFIAQAGKQTQTKLMNLTMSIVKPPAIPGFENKFDMSKMNIGGGVDGSSIEMLKNADVTSIVAATKHFMSSLFDKIIPVAQSNAAIGIDNGITGIQKALSGANTGYVNISKAIDGINNGITGLNKGIIGMQAAKTKLTTALSNMTSLKAPSHNTSNVGMPPNIHVIGGGNGISSTSGSGSIENFATAKSQLASQISTLDHKINASIDQLNSMQHKLQALIPQKNHLKSTITDLSTQYNSLVHTKSSLGTIFTDWKISILNNIDAKRHVIEDLFQQTLNSGFRNMFLAAALIAGIGLLLTLLLKNHKASNMNQINQN